MDHRLPLLVRDERELRASPKVRPEPRGNRELGEQASREKPRMRSALEFLAAWARRRRRRAGRG
jgi:hypothetical protein